MATDTLPIRAGTADRPPAARGFTGLVDIVQHLGELWDLGKILVESRMLPQSIQSPNAAVAIMLKGHELGIGPMHAFDGISVIQGKPTISPQLMQALVERSGLLEDIRVEESSRPAACRITLTRKGRSPQTIAFDQDEAQAMGLWGKGNWAKMPAVMLYWRCVAKAYRRVFPDVIAGCYTPDEMGVPVNEDGEIIDGEIVEAEPVGQQGGVRGVYSKDKPHPHNTGYGPGEFLPPEKNDQYNAWVKSFLEKANAKWSDHWEKALANGMGLPNAVPAELINHFRLTGHLMKWLREAKWLDPAHVRTEEKSLGPKYLSLVYHQSTEARVALKAEAKDYVGRVFKLTCDDIYRKHPDLAPDGWAEEQEEARRQAEEEAGEDALDEVLATAPPIATPEPAEDGWEDGRE